MSKPKTLLQIAGSGPAPIAWDRAALLLIDIQADYAGPLLLSGLEPALDAAARLLDLARRRGLPVIHIVHHGKPGGALFDPTGPGSAILPAVAPAANEAIVVKHLPDSFAGTGLADHLDGRSELVIGGFMTHNCVAATAWTALDLGLRNHIVAPATATRDLPDPLGNGIIPAAAVQAATLAALSDRCATIHADIGAL